MCGAYTIDTRSEHEPIVSVISWGISRNGMQHLHLGGLVLQQSRRKLLQHHAAVSASLSSRSAAAAAEGISCSRF